MDWVSARSKCSLVQMFNKLKMEVEDDVKRRQSLSSQSNSLRFEFVEAENSFTVIRSADKYELLDRVEFRLAEVAIQIRNSKGVIVLLPRITLNDAGECMFKIGDHELESWQLRRKALEPLFFD